MKRKTLDLIFSIGGGLLAVRLLVLGLVLQNQANFANTYVKDQLSAQRITFTPLEGLSDEEKKAQCLVDNAGKPMTSAGTPPARRSSKAAQQRQLADLNYEYHLLVNWTGQPPDVVNTALEN